MSTDHKPARELAPGEAIKHNGAVVVVGRVEAARDVLTGQPLVDVYRASDDKLAATFNAAEVVWLAPKPAPALANAELWTVDDAAAYLGVNVKSADKQLRRWSVAPVSRQPGRGGRNLYDAAAVRAANEARPGRGARSDLASKREASA